MIYLVWGTVISGHEALPHIFWKENCYICDKRSVPYNNYYAFHPTELDLPPPWYPPIKKKVFPLFLDIIQVLCDIYVLIVVVPCSSGIDLTYFLNNEIN